LTTTTFDKVRLEEKENRKLIILQITESILLKNGIDEVTIRNVAEKAGLSTGSIYLYFRNKEELLVSLLIQKLKILHIEIEAFRDVSKPAELFRSIARAFSAYFIKYGQYIDLFRYAKEGQQKDKIIDMQLMNELADTLSIIFKTIEQMISAGKIFRDLKGIPAHRIVPVLWSLALGVSQITLSSTRGESVRFDFDQVIDDCIRLLL
jgi:AcrR family transcriptional regulator